MSVQHLLHFVGIVLITEAFQGDPDSFMSEGLDTQIAGKSNCNSF